MRLRTLFLLVCGAGAVEVHVDGEVSFHLRYSKSLEQVQEKEPLRSQVTAGPVVECIYQYPEQKQIDAILSYMMNMLTKVYVRSQDLFTNEDGRRADNQQRQRGESRFKIIDNKNTQFFELIYHNMTGEYNKMYKSTADRAERAREPCAHQAEIKRVWRELLQHSLSTFRRAALRCVRERLRPRRADARARARLAQLLLREQRKLRTGQLHLLCDHFQLCYYDLL